MLSPKIWNGLTKIIRQDYPFVTWIDMIEQQHNCLYPPTDKVPKQSDLTALAGHLGLEMLELVAHGVVYIPGTAVVLVLVATAPFQTCGFIYTLGSNPTNFWKHFCVLGQRKNSRHSHSEIPSCTLPPETLATLFAAKRTVKLFKTWMSMLETKIFKFTLGWRKIFLKYIWVMILGYKRWFRTYG